MIKILVVDDDKDFLRLVSQLLTHVGYDIVTSEDPYGAIERMGKEVFDLILTDVNMPGGSGFDLVKAIRKHYSSRHVAVALLTGRRDKKDIFRGLELGADDYIVKPIDPDLFLAKVETLIKKKQTQKDGSIKFSSCSVDIPATWEGQGQIVEISEKGLILKAAYAPVKDFKFRLKSKLFDEIGIEAPTMRVLKVWFDEKDPMQQLVQTAFVGLVDQELQKIRFYVNSQISKKKDRSVA